MNNDEVIKSSELIIGLLPYRDEFILTEMITSISEGIHRKKFDELNYDFKKWSNVPEAQSVTDDKYVYNQMLNTNVIKRTRTVDGNEYYVLTKIGRKMRGVDGLRTFEKLNKYNEKKKADKEEKKGLTTQLMKESIRGIGVQESISRFNFWIALGTITAVLVGLTNLIHDPSNCEYPIWHPVFLVGGMILTVLCLLLWPKSRIGIAKPTKNP